MREIANILVFVAMSGAFYTLYARFRGCRLQQMRDIANIMALAALANVFHTPCASVGGWELQQMREITNRLDFVAMSCVFYTLCASFRGCRLQQMREIAKLMKTSKLRTSHVKSTFCVPTWFFGFFSFSNFLLGSGAGPQGRGELGGQRLPEVK